MPMEKKCESKSGGVHNKCSDKENVRDRPSYAERRKNDRGNWNYAYKRHTVGQSGGFWRCGKRLIGIPRIMDDDGLFPLCRVYRVFTQRCCKINI